MNDRHDLLIAVRYHEQAIYLDRQQARVAIETSSTQHNVVTGATAGGDERKLRGIPAIGRGVVGAIPGTIPHSVR